MPASRTPLAAHARQVRKGTTIPYAAHLLAVGALVLEHGGDTDQAVAALLHDIVEDCGAEHRDAIVRRYGARRRDRGGLHRCRHHPQAALAGEEGGLPRPLAAGAGRCAAGLAGGQGPQRPRHHGRLTVHGPAVFERFRGGQDGTLWYYRALALAFVQLLPGHLASALAEAVAQMEAAAATLPDSGVRSPT